ncbi:MAG TPA: hypothetical protein VIQ54_15125 [Polyangia bacterium]|jgi:hypothetical protein
MTSPRHELSGGERAALDGVLDRLYQVISFDEGGEPDWDGMKDVFSRHARITRVTPEGIDHLDLPTFCAMAREMLDLGAYTGFHEREVSRRVDRLGAVVHVLSAYETKRHPAAVDRLGQGVNSIQLVNEDGSWRVVSLCWDEDALRGPGVDLRSVVAGEVGHG